jgi:hypothetical protein
MNSVETVKLQMAGHEINNSGNRVYCCIRELLKARSNSPSLIFKHVHHNSKMDGVRKLLLSGINFINLSHLNNSNA